MPHVDEAELAPQVSVYNIFSRLGACIAQQKELDSLLCTAILGWSANVVLGLWPRVIPGYLMQPQQCMCRGGYLLLIEARCFRRCDFAILGHVCGLPACQLLTCSQNQFADLLEGRYMRTVLCLDCLPFSSIVAMCYWNWHACLALSAMQVVVIRLTEECTRLSLKLSSLAV